MKNNMKEINLNEMEKASGGRHLYNEPLESCRERITVQRIERLTDPALLEFIMKLKQKDPDMIDPELLRQLTGPHPETEVLQ